MEAEDNFFWGSDFVELEENFFWGSDFDFFWLDFLRLASGEVGVAWSISGGDGVAARVMTVVEFHSMAGEIQ